jgi:hypothetical protein
MLRHVAKISICFQRSPNSVGGSMQHGCNMARSDCLPRTVYEMSILSNRV